MTEYIFEDQVRITAIPDKTDVFTHVQRLWNWPNLARTAGSQVMAHAAGAAYETVPTGYHIHCFQAHFFKQGSLDSPLLYHVERALTSSKFACRVVQVQQEGIAKAQFTIDFMNSNIDETSPYDQAPKAGQETLGAATGPFDPELADFNFTGKADESRPPYWPKDKLAPAFVCQRLSVSKTDDVCERIYRSKLAINSPLSSRMAHIIGIIFMSDMYTADTPLTVQGLHFGPPAIGDRTKAFTDPVTRQFATLNHSMHFRKFDGWDAQEGVLFELKLRWLRGRRAISSLTVRDTKGDVIATAEQEVNEPLPTMLRDC